MFDVLAVELAKSKDSRIEGLFNTTPCQKILESVTSEKAKYTSSPELAK